MSTGPFQELNPQSDLNSAECTVVDLRMSAMEQAVQENRSITKRESTIRLFAAVFLAVLLLFLLGFRSVGSKAELAWPFHFKLVCLFFLCFNTVKTVL